MNRDSKAPGEATPDVHACEQAIRDLEALEWLRASKYLGTVIGRLEMAEEDMCLDEMKEPFRALLELLQPGEEAGRG